MSTNKKEKKHRDELVLCITEDGGTEVAFFPVSMSPFIIDNVYSKEERELAAKYNTRRIFCG